MEQGLGLVLKDLPASAIGKIAAAAEKYGVTHLFLPETGVLGLDSGRDPFISAVAALHQTETMRVGPGIASTPIRVSRLMGLQSVAINEQSGGRFILGIGVSHQGALESKGLPYPERAMEHLSSYTAELRQLSATAPYGAGFPVMIGALGPKMSALAARESDGIILNWLTVDAARTTTEALRAHAADAGNDDFSTVLFVRTGPADAVEFDARNYHDNLPNYARHFAGQGLDTVESVVAGTCVAPDAAAIATRMQEYADAGISVPCIYPTGMEPKEIIALLKDVHQYSHPVAERIPR